MLKALLLTLVLFGGAFAQELVGTSKGRAYYIMPPTRHERAVKFIGIISPYKDNIFTVDDNNFFASVFIADCVNYKYTMKEYMNVVDGKATTGTAKDEIFQAVKPQVIFSAITKACGKTDENYY